MTCPYVFIFARTNNHPIHSPVLSNYRCHWFSTALSPWLLRNVFFVARWQQLKSLERRGGPATRPGMQGEVCFLSLGIWSSKGYCWFWSFLAKSQNSTWKGPLGDVDVQNPSFVTHQGRYNMVELWRYTPFAKEIGILLQYHETADCTCCWWYGVSLKLFLSCLKCMYWNVLRHIPAPAVAQICFIACSHLSWFCHESLWPSFNILG